MSKKLARPLSQAAPALRNALVELHALTDWMTENPTDELSVAQLQKLIRVYAKCLAVAAGKVQRRADLLLGLIPEQLQERRREGADSFIESVATEVARNERDPVTVGEVERWLDDNYPDGARDPATIRAALRRLGRLKRNPRGRPRGATKK